MRNFYFQKLYQKLFPYKRKFDKLTLFTNFHYSILYLDNPLTQSPPRKYRTNPSTYFNPHESGFQKTLKKRRKEKHCFKCIHLDQKLHQNPKLFLTRLHLSTYFINATSRDFKKIKEKRNSTGLNTLNIS